MEESKWLRVEKNRGREKVALSPGGSGGEEVHGEEQITWH